jgi:ubiquitin-protein ligase E3 C
MQSLLTMGGGEFFLDSGASMSDELTNFSRQLLNIAFALYWREDRAAVLDGVVQSDVLRMKWEAARGTVTRCLIAIHARE